MDTIWMGEIKYAFLTREQAGKNLALEING